MRTWIDVAVLAKTRNNKGRFVVRATAGLPLLLETGDEVAFVPPRTDMPRSAVVQDVVYTDDSSGEIVFEGINAPDVARELVGSHCLIRRDLLDESVFQQAPGMWEGFAVVDESLGTVGAVSGLTENPAQSLLEVQQDDGTVVLVPVVDEIIRDVDAESRIVYVRLPQGLLDL